MWLGAAALAGATVVGINPTRRGAELARDITYTECQLIVTEPQPGRICSTVSTSAPPAVASSSSTAASYDERRWRRDRRRRVVRAGERRPRRRHVPAALHERHQWRAEGGDHVARPARPRRQSMIGITELTADDVTYISMPLFHCNALFTAWAPSVVSGAAVALRRTFSAPAASCPTSAATARPTSTTSASRSPTCWPRPSSPTMPTTRCVRGYGNEAAEADLARFARALRLHAHRRLRPDRDGASIIRVPGMPAGALGARRADDPRPRPGDR